MQPLLFPVLKEIYVVHCLELEKLPFEHNSAIDIKWLVVKECTNMVKTMRG